MNYLQQLILSFVVFLSFPTAVFADTTRGREFSCLRLDTLPEGEIYYKSAEGMKLIVNLPKRRSEAKPLKGSDSFRIFMKVEAEDGSFTYKVIGESKIPQETKTVLFILSAAEKGSKLPVRMIALDDSLKAFPKGTFRFANFTDEKFGIKFGELKRVIKPNALTLMKVSMHRTGGFMQMTMYGMDGEPLYGKKIFGQPNNRGIVFIMPSEDRAKKRFNIVTTKQAVNATHR